MISTTPRHAKHTRVAPATEALEVPEAPEAPKAAEGVARPRRRRRTRLPLLVAPVTAVLVAVGLLGMEVVAWPFHTTAHASRQNSWASVVNASPVALSCCYFPVSGVSASPPAKPWRHLVKPSVSPRSHAAVKPTASASASSGGAVGTGGDGTSPPGSVAGWRLTYSTDFPGNSLPSGWYPYSGEPGGDPDGNWVPSNVSVSGGAMHLMATPSGQAGVQFYGNPQTYGMYLVRMKGDYEPGLSINNLAILWPAQQGVWPPEVDFFQDAGGTRQSFSASLHAGPDGNGGCCVIASPTQDINETAWHTYGVQWTPSTITYTIDGRVWASVSSSSLSSPAQWPTIPMNLTLQSQNQDSAQPNGTIETMTVAWVAEYAMSG